MNRRQIDLVSQNWKVGIRNSEFGMTTQPTVNAESGHAAFRAVLWVLVGAVVMALLIVDPIGVSPVDEWLGVAQSGEAGHGDGDGHGDGLWTCGMHPEVIQNEPGICPICHMDLTPLRTDDSSEEQDAHAGHEDGLWTCPMHPDILEEEPGTCPICGMDLVPVETEPELSEGAGRENGAVVTIDPTVVQNMNVVTRTVERRDIAHEIRTVGYLEYDQERMVSVTTKFSGFIEKTYVNYLSLIHISEPTRLDARSRMPSSA